MRSESNRQHGQRDDHRRFARGMRGGGWDHDHDHAHDHGYDRVREGRLREGRGVGGRRGRVFDHGDLRLVMLQLIAEKPRHGY